MPAVKVKSLRAKCTHTNSTNEVPASTQVQLSELWVSSMQSHEKVDAFDLAVVVRVGSDQTRSLRAYLTQQTKRIEIKLIAIINQLLDLLFSKVYGNVPLLGLMVLGFHQHLPYQPAADVHVRI